MAWWDGVGAAKVLAHEEGAIFLECAMGDRSLSITSAERRDETACRIICNTANRLVGERGFDFANIFTNPDLGNPTHHGATLPKIFEQRLKTVTETAGLDRKRLLKWIIAWCGLSAAWSFESNDTASISITLEVAAQAIAELDR